jgi:hypothetical protein
MNRLVFLSALLTSVFASVGRSDAADPQGSADALEVCANHAESGERLQASGQLREARDHFIACAQSHCPRVIQSDCRAWLPRLEEATPTVLIRATLLAGEDLQGASARLDGHTLELGSGLPQSVDPGTHIVEVTHAGVTQRQTFVVLLGEKRKAVTLRFTAKTEPRAARTSLPQAAVPRWPGFLFFGGSIALFGTTGVMWGLGRSEYTSLRDGCGRNGTCNSADLAASRTKLIVGDIALGIGIAGLAASLYWLFVHSATSDSKRAISLDGHTRLR